MKLYCASVCEIKIQFLSFKIKSDVYRCPRCGSISLARFTPKIEYVCECTIDRLVCSRCYPEFCKRTNEPENPEAEVGRVVWSVV